MMNYLLEDFEHDRAIKRLLGEYQHYDTSELFQMIERLYFEHMSHYFFPGDLCLFYPRITEQKSKIGRLCDVSGARIKPGSFYCCYRPFLEDLSTGKKYVLKKTIHAEIAYHDYFPENLFEFEQFASNLASPYFLEDSTYNYSELSKNMGEVLELQELHSKGKVKS